MQSQNVFKNKKVLVVDDNSQMRQLLTDVLKSIGFENLVETDNVNNAKEIVLEAFNQAEPFDLVLCDHHMPNNSGLELISYIKMSMKYKDMAFITVTSDSDRSVVLPYISAGVDSFVVKPVSEKDLFNKISLVFKKKAGLS